MTDQTGMPEQTERQNGWRPPDTPTAVPAAEAQPVDSEQGGEQTMLLSTEEVGKILGVKDRAVRNYITKGIMVPGMTQPVKLEATQSLSGYKVTPRAVETFKALRDHAVAEGHPVEEIQQQAQEIQTLPAATMQLIAAELERKQQALSQAHQTIAASQAAIERLALQAGQATGRSEALERERDLLRQEVTELKMERDRLNQEREQLQQKVQKAKMYRIQLFPIKDE